jgi:NAD+ synthase
MAFVPVQDPSQWAEPIQAFLRHHLDEAKGTGYVLGMSGGLDSAVVGILAVRAVGKERVHAIHLPAPDSLPEDVEHARLACRAAGLKLEVHGIGPIVAGLDRAVSLGDDARLRGNAKARARMMVLYTEAQRRGALVCGTGNKSELLTGYFTKHGDGGVDVQPIGDLYKTQVRILARHLGVPAPIIEKPPSAGLYPGQTDEGDLGVTYDDLDEALKGLELNLDPAAVARKSGLSLELVQRVDAMVRRSEHKRRLALIPKLGARTVGIDWRRSVQWDG